MKGTIKLEAIGDNSYSFLRGTDVKCPYWVAQIIGFTEDNYERVFLRPKKDYRKANSIGSRGVYLYYILDSGKIYEVSEKLSWNRHNRFFCTVDCYGCIIKISAEEVAQWIRENSV